MAKFRIIGDVHGKYKDYIALTKECDYSIQIGDMGFDYNDLKELDPDKHKFIPGNHDNYDEIPNEYSLDRFGLYNFHGFKFYYIRGGFSIDWRQRQASYLRGYTKTYWDEEELPIDSMIYCLSNYQLYKPTVVISHDCPRSIANHIGNNEILKMFGYDPNTFTTRTSELLEMMFQRHQPDTWFFGHYHQNWYKKINATQFRCIDELSYVELEI